MSGDSYIPGDHYIACDVCGFKTRRSAAKKRWDGAVVCSADWEPRNPLDRAYAKPERQTLRDARPEPEDVFVSGNGITPADL